ncbi:rod shape-determining protein MreC [bacterium 1XD42-8]|jgi:rod shape-determining protein MreC|nr:rod shape-determining protein MreC [Lachnospiraceae bacterium]RKJ48731.1 rod shape-determining protein MreC [bacterium 1XD42-8]
MAKVRVKRKPYFTLPSKYVLLLMTLLCIGVMLITFTTDWLTGPMETVGSYVVVPFQRGISKVGTWFTIRSDKMKDRNELSKQNEELQARIDELTIENNELQQDKYELNRLRELYELDKKYSSYEKIGARVIGKDPGNWFSVFMIDKGSEDGIDIDMNVMAGSGLVGRIIQVGPNWATVRSIIDDSSKVSAMALATSDRMIVSGNLELLNDGYIEFGQLMDEEDAVKEGEKIVTSNISDKYLPGILIGYVSEIHKDSNNLTSSGYLTPAVDFNHLQEVLVILDLK